MPSASQHTRRRRQDDSRCWQGAGGSSRNTSGLSLLLSRAAAIRPSSPSARSPSVALFPCSYCLSLPVRYSRVQRMSHKGLPSSVYSCYTQELQIRIWIYESAHRSSTVPRHDASGLTGHAVISRPWLAASPDSWALAVRLPTHSNRWIAHLDRILRLPSLSAQRQLASCILNLPYVVHLGSVLQRLSTKHGTNNDSARLHDHLPR